MAKLAIVYNYQPFVITKYIGQANTRPSRVKATNVSSGKFVYVSWDHGLDTLENHLAAATALFEKLNADNHPNDRKEVKRVVMCGTGDSKGYIFTPVY